MFGAYFAKKLQCVLACKPSIVPKILITIMEACDIILHLKHLPSSPPSLSPSQQQLQTLVTPNFYITPHPNRSSALFT